MSKDIDQNKREMSKERKKYMYYIIFSKIISFIILFVILYFIYDVILWKKIYSNIFTKSEITNSNHKEMDLPNVIGEINISHSDKDNLIKFINVCNSKNIQITQVESSNEGGYKLLTDKNYYIILNNLQDIDSIINNFVNIYVDDNIQKLLSSDKLSYIDMSYKDKIYYKTKNQVNIDNNDNLRIKPSDILITSPPTSTNRH